MAYMNRGNAKQGLNRYVEAIGDYNRAIEIWERLVNEGQDWVRNDLAAAYMNRGSAKWGLNRYGEAIGDYNRAIEIREELIKEEQGWVRKDLAMAYMNRGVAKEGLNRYGEAIEDYNRAIEIRERLVNEGQDWVKVDLAKVYFNKAVLFTELKQFDSAIEAIDKAINLYKDAVEKENLQHFAEYFVKSLNTKLEILFEAINSTQDDFKKRAFYLEEAITTVWYILEIIPNDQLVELLATRMIPDFMNSLLRTGNWQKFITLLKFDLILSHKFYITQVKLMII